MKLPYRRKATVPQEKLTGYILSETHAVGKLKAQFFRAVGFDEINVSVLEKSLLNIAFTQEVKNVAESVHGKKYIIDGEIQAPNGRVIKARTVWILEPDRKAPRFVTTYPV